MKRYQKDMSCFALLYGNDSALVALTVHVADYLNP